MHRVFTFWIDVPAYILDNDFMDFYEPTVIPESLNIENGRYYGMYAWTTNKKIKKCFKVERNMEYFTTETMYLDDEEFKKFVEENDTSELKDRSLETFAVLNKKIVKGMEILSLTDFEYDVVGDQSCAQSTAFYYAFMGYEGTIKSGDMYKATSIISKKYSKVIWLIDYLHELSKAVFYGEENILSYPEYFYFVYDELNVLKVFMIIFGPLFKTNQGDILNKIIGVD